ncbi:hypothetical protein B0H14DRAFT_3473003 [Mycena olivaceomarginata]|nr:hypothetical protein B0H14DRAFT_3473003 [Mycena olivaceomarginata]
MYQYVTDDYSAHSRCYAAPAHLRDGYHTIICTSLASTSLHVLVDPKILVPLSALLIPQNYHDTPDVRPALILAAVPSLRGVEDSCCTSIPRPQHPSATNGTQSASASRPALFDSFDVFIGARHPQYYPYYVLPAPSTLCLRYAYCALRLRHAYSRSSPLIGASLAWLAVSFSCLIPTMTLLCSALMLDAAPSLHELMLHISISQILGTMDLIRLPPFLRLRPCISARPWCAISASLAFLAHFPFSVSSHLPLFQSILQDPHQPWTMTACARTSPSTTTRCTPTPCHPAIEGTWLGFPRCMARRTHPGGQTHLVPPAPPPTRLPLPATQPHLDLLHPVHPLTPPQLPTFLPPHPPFLCRLVLVFVIRREEDATDYSLPVLAHAHAPADVPAHAAPFTPVDTTHHLIYQARLYTNVAWYFREIEFHGNTSTTSIRAKFWQKHHFPLFPPPLSTLH